MEGLEKIKKEIEKKDKKMKCGDFEWEVNYFSKDGKVDINLFSDVAEGLVTKCIDFGENNENAVDEDYERNKNGEFKCQGLKGEKNGKKFYYGKNEYKKDCPKENRKKIKNISLNQMRKFYDEILSYQNQIENAGDDNNQLEKFRELLPYIKMQKAKVNLAYQKKNININFKRFIDLNIDYIVDGYGNNLEKCLEKFNIFVSLFEAVIAYSKGVIKEN